MKGSSWILASFGHDVAGIAQNHTAIIHREIRICLSEVGWQGIYRCILYTFYIYTYIYIYTRGIRDYNY